MNKVQKLRMFAILIFGLQAMSLQGAEESKMSENNEQQRMINEQNRQVIINESIRNLPNLVQGFDVLQNENLSNQSFREFLNTNLAREDEEPNGREVIQEATDFIVNTMKKPFLAALNHAIQNNMALTNIVDPIFLYVMQHKDGFMKLPIEIWINSDLTHDEEYEETMSSLTLACKKGNVAIVKLLLAAGANEDGFMMLPIKDWINGDSIYDTRFKVTRHMTPLMFACSEGHVAIVKLLLAADVDVDITNNNFGTALMYACDEGNEEIVKLLLSVKPNLDIQDDTGLTALMRIVSGGTKDKHTDVRIVELLLEAGADVNMQDDDGQTALHDACRNNNVEIIKLLLAKNPDLDLQGFVGKTALHIACERNNVEITQLLCEHNADIDIVDNGGNTAEQLATTPEMRNLWVQIKANRARRKRQRDKDFLDLDRSIKKN